MMRLSNYRPVYDSTPMWVIQACHPKGPCEPVLTYRHAMPPIYSMISDGALRIELLGGSIQEVHRDEIQAGTIKRRIIIQHHRGEESRAQLSRFRQQLGLPPGTGYYDTCDRALDVRPNVKAR